MTVQIIGMQGNVLSVKNTDFLQLHILIIEIDTSEKYHDKNIVLKDCMQYLLFRVTIGHFY